ncbi:Synaptotagmin-14-like protein [Leptotrombidium deliense]|uniref:Synaptotagmin-14-like protein n=1 Tax=Leptotrombidium deliense TaxID=299467 RepID=A0A443SKC8_9ACAR|nr:Synaptotagmin-14-like protein [Leptotrombidium deliense]
MLTAVPAEATAYLGFVGVCVVFLVVFYLYLSKKLCFTTIGNFPCCDDPINVDKKKVYNDLGCEMYTCVLNANSYKNVKSVHHQIIDVLK